MPKTASRGATKPLVPTRIWDQKRSETQKAIGRLLASASKPTHIRHSVKGAEHGWGMSLQDRVDFRVLQVWSRGEVTQSDSMHVLSEMIEKSATTIEEFERIHRSLIEEASLASSTTQRWRFVIPFNLQVDKDVHAPITFRVLGKTLRVQSWMSATRCIGKTRVRKALISSRSPQLLKAPEWCISAKSEGFDLSSAWASLDGPFDALRGIIELGLGYMSKTMRWPEGPLRMVPHPPWILAWNEETRTVERLEFITDELEFERHHGVTLDRAFISVVRSNLALFKGEPDSETDTRSLVGDGLRLYLQALDANRHHRAFLGLWQCAETITLATEDRVTGNKICARLAGFARNWCCDLSAVKDTLDPLYQERCKIVHRGIHDGVSIDDVNFMKNICELGLAWLMENCRRIPSRRALKYCYEYSTLSASELEVIEESVKATKSLRAVVRGKRRKK